MRDALKNLVKEVQKLEKEKVVLEQRVQRENKTTYYFRVGKSSVIIKIFLEGVRIYRKEFECDCTHASLFGTKHNIPCKHIFRVIQHICNKGLK